MPTRKTLKLRSEWKAPRCRVSLSFSIFDSIDKGRNVALVSTRPVDSKRSRTRLSFRVAFSRRLYRFRWNRGTIGSLSSLSCGRILLPVLVSQTRFTESFVPRRLVVSTLVCFRARKSARGSRVTLTDKQSERKREGEEGRERERGCCSPPMSR